MRKLLHFGLTKSMNNTNSGSLLSCEREKIIDFLCRDGLLFAECFDSIIVISHPRLVEKIKLPMVKSGLQPLLLGATLQDLRQVTSLTLAENRVMESLCPGSIIIMRDESLSSEKLPVAIPDNFDLRDILSSFNGVMQVYIGRAQGGLSQLEGILQNLDKQQCNFNMVGVLEPSNIESIDNRVTIVRTISPGDVQCISEGAINLKTVVEASNRVSAWEVEDWT